MVTYEVTAIVDPALVEAYERYMRERHIRDVLATGCFRDASFARAQPGRYRVRYRAGSREELDRYLDEHTARLRADFVQRFPAGVELARETWEEVQRWP